MCTEPALREWLPPSDADDAAPEAFAHRAQVAISFREPHCLGGDLMSASSPVRRHSFS